MTEPIEQSSFTLVPVDTTKSGSCVDAANIKMEEQQPQSREGSPSLPIRDLVIKAKKAASSLWTILHAQSCTLPNSSDSRSLPGSTANSKQVCNHSGCAVTKRLLIHIKGCTAAFDELPCPSNVQGCQTVRKLLNHYRTCRDNNSRHGSAMQHGSRINRSSRAATSNQDPSSGNRHQCLVCSLVARHARNALEGAGRSGPLLVGSSKMPLTATVRVPAKLVRVVDEQDRKEHEELALTAPPPEPNLKLARSESMKLMPPPPPRLPLQTNSSPSSSMGQPEVSPSMFYGTPPSYHQLLNPVIVSAACAAAVLDSESSSAEPRYRRPRSQSINDNFYNQFSNMGGIKSSNTFASRSYSDLRHSSTAAASYSFETNENLRSPEEVDDDSGAPEEQYNLEI